ncbi:MAG: hypothetical protein HQL82_01600 [Magnetococcales bacterium]|nr:hypothetical protein [Magnetococcales bacterium]
MKHRLVAVQAAPRLASVGGGGRRPPSIKVSALVAGLWLSGCATASLESPPVLPLSGSEALARARIHSADCRRQRAEGTLQTRAEEAACINGYLDYYRDAGFRHLDLGEVLASYRLDLARQVDAGTLHQDSMERALLAKTAEVNSLILIREGRLTRGIPLQRRSPSSMLPPDEPPTSAATMPPPVFYLPPGHGWQPPGGSESSGAWSSDSKNRTSTIANPPAAD